MECEGSNEKKGSNPTFFTNNNFLAAGHPGSEEVSTLLSLLALFHFSFSTLDHFLLRFPLLFSHCDFLFLSRHAQLNDVSLIHLEREWVRHKRQTTTLTCSQFYHIVIINGLPFHRHEIMSTSETVLREREREILKERECVCVWEYKPVRKLFFPSLYIFSPRPVCLWLNLWGSRSEGEEPHTLEVFFFFVDTFLMRWEAVLMKDIIHTFHKDANCYPVEPFSLSLPSFLPWNIQTSDLELESRIVCPSAPSFLSIFSFSHSFVFFLTSST